MKRLARRATASRTVRPKLAAKVDEWQSERTDHLLSDFSLKDRKKPEKHAQSH